MLEYGFESRLGLGFSGFSIYIYIAFSDAHHQGFSQGTPVSFPPSWVNGSANKIKLK